MTDQIDQDDSIEQRATPPRVASAAASTGTTAALSTGSSTAGERSRPPQVHPGRGRHLRSVLAGPDDGLAAARDRHPSMAMDRHLDTYFAAVARELEVRGVIAGPPQRSASPSHLSGSIVIDCTAVWSAVDVPGAAPSDVVDPGGEAERHEHPLPVIVAWDEDHGWVVGLHLDAVSSSCRLPHPALLPAPEEVAEFVVGLARLQPPAGVAAPVPGLRPSRLRLLR